MAKLYRLHSPWQNMREPIYLWDLKQKKKGALAPPQNL